MQNSFKALLEEDRKHFEKHHQEDVQKSLESNLTALRFIGEIVEIYLSRVKDIAVIAVTNKDKT